MEMETNLKEPIPLIYFDAETKSSHNFFLFAINLFLQKNIKSIKRHFKY